MSIAPLLDALIDLYMLAILGRVIWSWVSPRGRHPLARLLYRITEPMLSPIRSILPRAAGIDFSPAVALLLLSLIGRLV